jgi:hypothetical protein
MPNTLLSSATSFSKGSLGTVAALLTAGVLLVSVGALGESAVAA